MNDTPSAAQPTVQQLAQLVHGLQQQLAEANTSISAHRSELNVAADRVQTLENELRQTHQRLTQAEDLTAGSSKGPKVNKPKPFSGRWSITSWAIQMDN